MQFFRLCECRRERLAPELLFIEFVGIDQRTHRSVEEHDPPWRESLRADLLCSAFPFVAIGNASPVGKVDELSGFTETSARGSGGETTRRRAHSRVLDSLIILRSADEVKPR